MKFRKSQGFTLIELLVVIAIIGILASIVLVSFPSAGKKAKDSRVKSGISQARTVMTSYWGNYGNYGVCPNCFATGTPADEMPVLYNEVTNNAYNKTAMVVVVSSALGNATSCMYAVLNEKNGTTWYCADSTGVSGTTAINPSTLCAAANLATCPAFSGD